MIKYLFLAFCIFWATIAFFACNKKSITESGISPDNRFNFLNHYTNKFIQDENFAKYYGEIFKSQYNLGFRYRTSTISRERELDTTAYYTDAAYVAILQAQIMLVDSGYVQLNAPQVQEIMQNIADSLSSESFRARYSDSPLVTNITEIVNEIIEQGGLQTIEPMNRGCDLTMNEIVGCVGGGIAVGVLDLWGPAKQIYNLIKGTGSWGFSEILSFAISAVKAYVPWTKLLSIGITIASCLVVSC